MAFEVSAEKEDADTVAASVLGVVERRVGAGEEGVGAVVGRVSVRPMLTVGAGGAGQGELANRLFDAGADVVGSAEGVSGRRRRNSSPPNRPRRS